MLITARQAEAGLAGVGVTRRQARRLIACGAAGPVTRTTAAVLVDSHRVAALGDRESVERDVLDELFPWGLFVARREIALLSDESEAQPGASVLAQLASGWAFSYLTRVWLDVQAGQHGYVPAVATVAGFVLAGAEIRGAHASGLDGAGRQLHDLRLDPPGAWFEHVRDRRINTPAGRPWVVFGWDHHATGRTRWPNAVARCGGRP